jgi:cytochrome P450
MTTRLDTANMDLADPAFWQRPQAERLAAFARLRQLDAPQFFAERTGGFYALVRHADVAEASRKPDVFISGPGVTMPRPPRWVRVLFGDSMVNLDDPRHASLRGIVSRAFTPRVVAKAVEDVQRVASAIVDDVVERRPADFVEAVAAQLPFQVICNMMGVPEAYRARILGHVEHATEGTEVRAARRIRLPGKSLRALARLHLMVARVGRERRRRPADDLISALVTANVDGKRLTARELGAFFSLLLVAGVETTRNTVAHGLVLLTDNPAQRELLCSDLDRYLPGFVEEVVRHSSPIIQFRRTVARDHELRGHPLRAGDDVVLFYTSANRDETVFAEPDTFDLTRTPNPHVGFGGGGPHFCLGASLARQELAVLFRELLTRLPDIRATAPPVLVPSSFDNRVGRLPFTFTPPGLGVST